MVHVSEEVKEVLPVGERVLPGVSTLREMQHEALAHPEVFWRKIGAGLHWFQSGEKVFEELHEPPFGKWFSGWKTNLCYNALDRWVENGNGNKVAIHWIGEDGEERALTYSSMLREVRRLAAALRELGVRKGDRVTIYLPLIPEAAMSMLACARIGAIHSVVFGGFAGTSLVERVNDSGSRIIITADGGWRRGKPVELKKIVDASLKSCPTVEHVILVRRLGNQVETNERDILYDELLEGKKGEMVAAHMDGTDPSFILYTSGTTGKPKGVVHGTGGYMLWAYYTTKTVFDLKRGDVYWCTADVGWITGHTYGVYGPLLNGATSVMYEGAPDYPAPDRWWSIVEDYGITVLYTAPTAIRSFMKQGERWPGKHDLSSLRLLGTVGEPINPEAWKWYYNVIGGGRCFIVDTWWQTETGGIMVSNQPANAVLPMKPGSASFPLPGVDIAVVNEAGQELQPGEKGFLVINRPWPGEFLGLWNDRERYEKVYFSRFKGRYYAADYAIKDNDGYFWFLGRADEVLKISGHRIGTIELEDALISHRSVAESAVIGVSDSLKGETPVAFVVLRPGHSPSGTLVNELKWHIRENVGPIAEPSQIFFVERLPKTRSGKIMRRLIKAVVERAPLGDTSTLEDEATVEEATKAYLEFSSQLNRN
ncbi:MAG: acetate--CoA ligase [Methanomassiliicoccales archaeon]